MTSTEKKDYWSRIEESLDSVRPFLKRDGGDVELVDISEDFTVSIKLIGSCRNCQMSEITMKTGIEESIKKSFPQMKQVVEIR